MDLFEYFGYFREGEPDRVMKAENRVILHLLDKYFPAEGSIIDTSAGNGDIAFHFAEKGYSVTAGDLFAENVDNIKADSRFPSLKDVYCAHPRSLGQFADESFDALVTLGSVYYMRTNAQREALIKESLRVLKPDGIVAFSYMTPLAMTLDQLFTAMRAADNLEKLKAYRKLATVEKNHECGMFHGMTLEEMTDIAREYDMEILTIAGTYSLLPDMAKDIDSLSDEDYEKFVDSAIATCEDPFVSRYCLRGILIAKKKPYDIFD